MKKITVILVFIMSLALGFGLVISINQYTSASNDIEQETPSDGDDGGEQAPGTDEEWSGDLEASWLEEWNFYFDNNEVRSLDMIGEE